MRVHLIDVGQGAATLLEFPCAAVLVDTGGEDDEDFHSTPRLEAYLDAFFARRADLHGTLALLVLTHPHIDHARGAAMVVERYHVERLVTDGLERTDLGGAEQTALEHWAQGHHVPYFAVHAADVPAGGLSNDTIDPVACEAVDPRLTVLWGAIAATDVDYDSYALDNMNNHSVVLRVELGHSSLLVSGDLQTPGIKALLAKHAGTPALDADVWEVGHHGSPNGMSDALVAAISPAIALIACGDRHREHDWTAWKYGHPRRMVVEALAHAVTDRRRPKRVDVAEAVERFMELPLYKAVYATGWDGDVVVELAADGTRSVRTGR
jgi:competence protein ComEC